MTDPAKIIAGVDIAMRLVSKGLEMYEVLKKDDLTEDQILALIDIVNDEQEKAKSDLQALLGDTSPEA